MEAGKNRNIQSGAQYDHLFPRAEKGTETIVRSADVGDTVAFIPNVVARTLHQTKGIAQQLQQGSPYETCRAIWQFVYRHIAYKKDKDGYEQIRSPARAWHDRRNGVDCDCYSTFISSILTNLAIPHTLRITKYNGRSYFQHIYPIVPQGGGKHITLDCVTDAFDYEVPFSEKQDHPMELQYLNGFDGTAPYSEDYILNGADGMGELGKIVAKRFAPGAKKTASPAMPQKGKPFLPMKKTATVAQKAANIPPGKAKGLKKVLNVVNKVNPATVALRNGILAAMKLNTGNTAGRLRWSYLSPADAAKKGVDPQGYQKLLQVRQKLESIFYGAGGKLPNLKKAILSGKGNKDKQVRGLGELEYFDPAVEYMNTYTPFSQLLGPELYYSENVDGFEGLGELGEPVTLATMAAASGVIASIMGMLKQVGDVFKGKGTGAEDFSADANAKAEGDAAATATEAAATTGVSTALAPTTTTITTTTGSEGGATESGEGGTTSTAMITANAKTTAPESGSGDDEETFWQKNKKILLPVAIGVGGISIIAIGMAMLKPKGGAKSSGSGRAMNGLPRRRKTANRAKKTAKRKPAKRTHYKTAVALL